MTIRVNRDRVHIYVSAKGENCLNKGRVYAGVGKTDHN